MRIEKNYVVKNKNFAETIDLLPALFGSLETDKESIVESIIEEIIVLKDGVDMFDVLVHAGLFRSKTDAKKNWKRTDKEIPKGFSDFQNLGKLHHRITIFNPDKI